MLVYLPESSMNQYIYPFRRMSAVFNIRMSYLFGRF